MGAFVVLNTLVVVSSLLLDLPFTARYREEIWPLIFPAAALAAMGATWCFAQRARYFPAFVASSVMILLLIVAAAYGMHPNLLVSSIDPAYDLTIFNAASEDNTLTVALVIALIGMPFVLLYTAGVYYVFRGKVSVEPTATSRTETAPGRANVDPERPTAAGVPGHERRLLALDRQARRWLIVAILAGVGAVVALVIQLATVALVVAGSSWTAGRWRTCCRSCAWRSPCSVRGPCV